LRAEIRLVLMIEGKNLNRLAKHRSAKVGDGHFDRLDAGRADDVGIGSRHVVDVADHDLVIGGPSRAGGQRRAKRAGHHQHASE
jgi:hypothetical protein